MIGKTISHYKILEKVGEGGMGVVYKAEDTKLKRTIALKFLPRELMRDQEARDRFMKEAQAAAALDHPHICTVHEIDEVDGKTFIAMAYIEGQSLKEKIEAGQMEIDDVVEVAFQVAGGLKEAHDKGIIHRDIKPANIMLTEKGQAKIMDFGLAKLEWGVNLTKTATILGTVAYMSPEQARGEKVDHRTDIWSLGCVLYEMITGQRPFKSDKDQAAIYAILNEAPQPLANLKKELTQELEQTVNKCLEKNPDKRYQDANEIIDDLSSLQKKLKFETTESQPAEKKPSIAVLPFVDMSPQKDQEYFCDGIAEELINALTHIKDMRVVARTSAFSFKRKELDIREIGRKLNVEMVLEGSVRKAGNRLRITAQLINVADGYHLWSERFDRELSDVFAIQDEISLAITDKMKLKLLGEERERIVKRYTEDLDAYSLYLKGLYFRRKMTEDNIKKAMKYFNLAIEKDPDYALAFAGLAYAYLALSFYASVSSKKTHAKAKQAVLRAMNLDNQLAESYEASALISAFFEWQWETAKKECRRAIELNPGYVWARFHLSNFLGYQARFDESIKEMHKAHEFDPLNVGFNRNLGAAYLRAGKFEKAIEILQRTIEMDPSFPASHLYLGYTYMQKSMYEEALAEIQKDTNIPEAFLNTQVGIVYARLGKREEAIQILNKYMKPSTREFKSPYGLALLCFALGENDLGIQWLERAYETHDMWMCSIKIDFLLDSVRTDLRFKKLLKKMNLE